MAAGNTGSNQSFDALLKLLPGVISAYPSLMSVFGEQGIDRSQINQLTAALPQVLEKVKETDPKQLEALVAQITEAVPGLKDVLPKQERRRRR